MRKMEYSSCSACYLELPAARKTVESKRIAVGELSTSNLGPEVAGVGPEVAPNVSARGSDDVDMGDEVGQRRVSDAESVGSDEVRESRRRNSPSNPTSGEVEDHVVTGHACFRSWCAASVQRRGRAETPREMAAGSWRTVQRSQSCRGITVSLEPGIESVKLRWNSEETVRSW